MQFTKLEVIEIKRRVLSESLETPRFMHLENHTTCWRFGVQSIFNSDWRDNGNYIIEIDGRDPALG